MIIKNLGPIGIKFRSKNNIDKNKRETKSKNQELRGRNE